MFGIREQKELIHQLERKVDFLETKLSWVSDRISELYRMDQRLMNHLKIREVYTPESLGFEALDDEQDTQGKQ